MSLSRIVAGGVAGYLQRWFAKALVLLRAAKAIRLVIGVARLGLVEAHRAVGVVGVNRDFRPIDRQHFVMGAHPVDASRRISTARSLDMRADGCIFVQCMLLPSPY